MFSGCPGSSWELSALGLSLCKEFQWKPRPQRGKEQSKSGKEEKMWCETRLTFITVISLKKRMNGQSSFQMNTRSGIIKTDSDSPLVMIPSGEKGGFPHESCRRRKNRLKYCLPCYANKLNK